MTFDSSILESAIALREVGFAVHYLHPRQKRPIGKEWQESAVSSVDDLRRYHQSGVNLGVRLGEPSLLANDTYLHVIDVDIRVAELVDEALAALRDLLPVDPTTLPMVRSGSGGASCHLYFVSDKPFRSKKLAQSDDKFRQDDGRWSRLWEIELFGTGKQVVLPPSIHPNGKPYVWEREFDDFALQFDGAYQISSDALTALAVPDDTKFEYEDVAPLDFKEGVMERLLDDIPVSDLDYDDWIRLGQAIHHQLGGTEEAFQLWLKHTERSEKHDHRPATVRTMRMKWRSFGRYRGRPVTMATISQWAKEARLDALADEFDDLEDLEDLEDAESAEDEFDGLFDTGTADDAAVVRDTDGDSSSGSSDDDPFKSDSKLPWRSLLDTNEEGGYRSNLHNLKLIVANDPRFRGVIRMNLLAQGIVRMGKPGKLKRREKAAKPTVQLEGRIWQQSDTVNGDPWYDDHDGEVRAVIEAPKTMGGYGIKVSDRDLNAAIRGAANQLAFHPVQDYLKSLNWDGQERLDNLFIDYLRTPDNAYYRQIARLTLVAAVTRVFEPGHKWDTAPIIEGLQGRRKSTFIKILGKNWASELDGDFADDKLMIEKMQGKWILEMPELSGFSKAEVNHIKAFMTRQEDRARMSYDRRVTDFRRQCIFIGTTNDKKYLKDESGGRRFWPVECGFGPDEEIDTEKLEVELDQIWAEAYHRYVEMRKKQPSGVLPLYLRDKDASRIASQLQESRRVHTQTDTLRGIVEEWLDTPIASGELDELEPAKRTKTCALDIWVNCLGKERTVFPPQDKTAIVKILDSLSGWKESGQRRFDAKIGRQIAYIRQDN